MFITRKLGIYIMAPESIKTACFIKSLTSLCVSVCASPIDARQRLVNNSPVVAWQWLSINVNAPMNTQATLEELLDAIRFVSKKVGD
jgi:hypothetical protein